MRPKVLVLDEPTTSLDPRGTEEVFRTLARLRQNGELGVILISQDSERVAEYSDRVIALEAGRIAAQGTAQQVFSDSQLMGRLGVRIPQVSQLADCLNRTLGTDYSFLTLDQAAHTLTLDLERKRNP
jgi:ABC-type multidrug transport system ATPase subunit